MDNFSLDVSERNSMATITLNTHTKPHTVRGRPTLTERFGNGSVRKLYERSIYERCFTNEQSIEKFQTKPAISNERAMSYNVYMYLDVVENPVEYQKLL